jgi:hypothetical protein
VDFDRSGRIAHERWTYRRFGKTVIFENGVVVRVE